MKKYKKYLIQVIAVFVLIIIISTVYLFGKNGAKNLRQNLNTDNFNYANTNISNLTDLEKKSLIYMREEEKLARDVYMTLFEKWGLNIFSNIARSEDTHTEAIRSLLQTYQISDSASTEVGVFTNADLQNLYTDLVTRGSVSLKEALIVGVTIEDLDIHDLYTQLKNINNQDIINVYENLMRGSRNHLRSFNSQLKARGVIYTPQYISVAEYESIITSDMERAGKDN